MNRTISQQIQHCIDLFNADKDVAYAVVANLLYTGEDCVKLFDAAHAVMLMQSRDLDACSEELNQWTVARNALAQLGDLDTSPHAALQLALTMLSLVQEQSIKQIEMFGLRILAGESLELVTESVCDLLKIHSAFFLLDTLEVALERAKGQNDAACN